MRRYVWLLLLVALLVLPTGSSSTTFARQDTNLLQNPGFEGEFVTIGGDPAVQVAAEWQPWHLPPPPGAGSSINLRPDYQAAPANRIHSGSSAQQYDTFYATHVAGVFQQVSVTPDTVLTFSAFIYPYSSAEFDDIDQSVDPQGLRVSVGIDPSGGTDGGSTSIIWSTPVEYYDEYREITVSTTAVADTITVFVRSSVDNAPGLHQVFVDDASLMARDTVPTDTPTPSVTPTEGPTSTPSPTVDVTVATLTPTATPSATRDPGATVTATPTTPVPSITPTVQRTPYSDEFPNELVHTVQSGDTVSTLAILYDSDTQAIIEYNGLSNTGFIVIGQKLLIPVRAGIGDPVNPPTATPTPTMIPTVPPGGGAGSGSDGTAGTDLYVVQQGDTLFRIALRFNVTPETLAQYNGILNPNRLQAGQVLRIPPSDTTGGMVPTAMPINPGQPVNIPPGNYEIYTVRFGDNLFRIGLRYNMTADVIARANGILNPNLIFVGQQLIIPR